MRSARHLLALMLMAALAGAVAAGSRAEAKTVTWLFARPVDGPVIQTVKEIAAEFQKIHPDFELALESTPDRPSYLQKLEILAAAGDLPEMFDTDPTVFAEMLKNRGELVDVEKLLREFGKLDEFRPAALDYVRFDDGSLYLLPLEFHLEVFWYNTDIFKNVGVEPPETLEELVEVAKILRSRGYIPIAVAGKEQWPLLRYLAFIPFRMTGNDYIMRLKRGEASLQDPIGMQAARFVYELGKNNAFQTGFASHDYVQARDLFVSGKAAMYYMGSWELGTFTSDSLPDSTKGKLSYFKLPMTDNARTTRNEYFVVSGIGLALNAKKFDNITREFIRYLLDRYPTLYAAKEQFPPTKYELPGDSKVSELYRAFAKDIEQLGKQFGVPWDTELDPASNSRIGQALLLLAQTYQSPEEFARTMDAVIKENAPSSASHKFVHCRGNVTRGARGRCG
ncbi:ABC transporter substrate-binding protein [Geochorda subterranea]|uniref:Extracellular solute-binding protein n=1 Tax=Geochorda subterranea TaxID=3109564 RepID=A0ABZ1BP05_9FIRM|nr:extracellular solute-binding protein [Limnochorda sp. LNt]WRP14546.1 extracellular solute-binding protein [Limnochorda sp. LNt]